MLFTIFWAVGCGLAVAAIANAIVEWNKNPIVKDISTAFVFTCGFVVFPFLNYIGAIWLLIAVADAKFSYNKLKGAK